MYTYLCVQSIGLVRDRNAYMHTFDVYIHISVCTYILVCMCVHMYLSILGMDTYICIFSMDIYIYMSLEYIHILYIYICIIYTYIGTHIHMYISVEYMHVL